MIIDCFDRKIWIPTLIFLFGLGAGVGWIFGTKNSDSLNFKLSGLGTSVEMEAKNENINYEVVLNGLYSNSILWGGLKEWLLSKQIYSIESLEFAIAVSQKLCAPFPENLEERLRLQDKCENKPVVDFLRRLSKDQEIPFHSSLKKIRISVPDSMPPQGRAFTCRNGDFLMRTVELSNQKNSEMTVIIKANAGDYDCTRPDRPKIQLNRTDAARVIDRNAWSDTVFAVIVE